MEIKYNRNDIDKNLSMGEYALLYYDNIVEKNTLNKIIISNILRLYKKGYLELNNNKENKLEIKIKDSKESLKISEIFIYECLKVIDSNNDLILTLDEFSAYENNVFSKYKNQIKELIIQEAMTDKLINIEKFKKKRKYFFRALEVLVIFISSFLIGFINEFSTIILIIVTAIIVALGRTGNLIKATNYSKNSLKKLKTKLLNDEIMQYSSKTENKKILIEFTLFIIIYYMHLYLAREVFIYIGNLFVIELIIMLIFAIVEYIKFNRADIYTDKAILYKQKLEAFGKYLKDYSLIKERNAIEVYLWEDYLTFSVLLGINRNITKEIKINLSNDTEKKNEIQYDYYENKYFYINDKNEKIYVD